MYRRDYPCSCGKSTFTVVAEMDDWNREREQQIMNCPECAEKKRIAKTEEVKEREQLKELDKKITKYFTERYMGQWLTYFTNAKNKKETWALATEVGIEKDSLSSFYNRRKGVSMDEYIRGLASYDKIQKIMQALHIEDSGLESMVKKATELKKAEYFRLISEWHRNH